MHLDNKIHLPTPLVAFLFFFFGQIYSAQSIGNLNEVLKQSDSLLLKSAQYIVENPQQALLYAHQSIKNARLKNDTISISAGYILLAKAYLNTGETDRAVFYIDALENLIDESKGIDLHLELTELKTLVLIASGNNKAAEDLIEKSIKSIKKTKDAKKIIWFHLLKGNSLKQHSDFSKSIEAKDEAKRIAVGIGDSSLLAECYHSLGSSFYQHSMFNAATEMYERALFIRKQLYDTLAVIETLKNISITSRDQGNFEDSRRYLTEALSLANVIGNKPFMADCYNLIGSLELRIGNYTQAVSYYDQSLRIREQLGYLSSTASTLENLSRVYLQLGLFVDAEKTLTKAISLRQQLNDFKNLAAAQNDLGNVYSQKGELAEALKYYLTSLKIRQEWGESADIARSLTNIGITYRKFGSHKNALKYFNEALELVPAESDPIGKAYIFIHQGNTFRDLGNPQLALKSYTDALELRTKAGNQILVAQSLRSVALAYSDIGDFSNALTYIRHSIEIYEKNDDQKGIADACNEMGNILTSQTDFENALIYFEKAAILYGKHFDIERRGLCLRKIGEIQLKLGRFYQAIENLNLALKLAEGTKNGKLVETTLLSLYEYHFARGEFQEAIKFYQQHVILRDSLSNIHRKEEIWQASLDLELDKKAAEIRMIEDEVDKLRQDTKLKEFEIERQKLIRNFFAIGFLFILTIATLSVWGFVIIQKRNKQLKEINEKLAKSQGDLQMSLRTKDKLFSIIAHDLKSPFTALVGLTEVLQLKATTTENQEFAEYSGYVHESSHKLLALIENLLDWTRSQTGKIILKPTPISPFDIFSQTIELVSLQAASKGIRITIDADMDKSLSFYADFDTTFTVLRNLVSNAIKFTDVGGNIWLNALIKDSKIVLVIQDSGIGIAREDLSKLFKLDTNASTKGTKNESGTGLGLIVCKEFVEMNNGSIWVESEVGTGTSFYVSLRAKQV